jgi:Fe-Mn family superoxide dismutase
MAPVGKGGEPVGKLAEVLKKEFASIDRFKKEFTQSANSVEGSGWGALVFDLKTERPLVMQIEKHNVNIHPHLPILMVVDVWEHAYYLDYKNERGKFTEAFWKIVNWKKINKRLEELLK